MRDSIFVVTNFFVTKFIRNYYMNYFSYASKINFNNI